MTVDIIIPVYCGYAETKSCIESVLKSKNKSKYKLTIINDFSPDFELTKWLRCGAQSGLFKLLENEENIGFVGTVNRGMSLSRNDVILLNSDTEVADFWIDKINNAAEKNKDIGTITPFSNNATICSYPRFCEDNPLPVGVSLAEIDDIFHDANRNTVIDIPTAVGFCMYIRRACLESVGLFDVENFGKGYGEENDFSCRATKTGWRNVLLCDTFVWHKGNVSFGDSHNEKKTKALKVLQKLHPEYSQLVHKHIQEDPAREMRLRVDFLRFQRSKHKKILFVVHALGGGTEQHCMELVSAIANKAHVFKIYPVIGGLTCLESYSETEAIQLYFDLPVDYVILKQVVRALGIDLIHFHHTLGVAEAILSLAKDLNLAQYFTIHDYHLVCPQITLTGEDNRYCGEEGIAQCKTCVGGKTLERSAQTIESWRERANHILVSSHRVIVPDKDVSARYNRYFPHLKTITTPHLERASIKDVHLVLPSKDEPLRIAVIGALSPVKGADLLEAVSLDCAKNNIAVKFKLFGYAYRHLSGGDHLDVSGKYATDDLPRMLEQWKPHLVWFPAQWPETYSYTLSQCMHLGLPVVATNLGAIAQRLSTRPYSWVLPWQTTPSEWMHWFASFAIGNIAKPGLQPFSEESGLDFYRTNYLDREVVICSQPIPSIDVLYKTRNKKPANGWRNKIIHALFYLRSLPILSWLARRIPMHLQRRLKQRLLNKF